MGTATCHSADLEVPAVDGGTCHRRHNGEGKWRAGGSRREAAKTRASHGRLAEGGLLSRPRPGTAGPRGTLGLDAPLEGLEKASVRTRTLDRAHSAPGAPRPRNKFRHSLPVPRGGSWPKRVLLEEHR